MKTKSKLWFGLCAIVLCFGAMAFGVYSVLSANLNLSGNLGFNMHNAIVEVSGTISPVAEKDSLGTSFTPTTKQIKRTAMGGEEQTVSNLDVGDLYFYNQEDMVFDLSFKNIGLSPINTTITIDLGSNSDKIYIVEDTEYIRFTNNTYENFILADDTKQVKFALKLNDTSIELGKNAFNIEIAFAEVVTIENIVDNSGYYQGIKYTLDSTTPLTATTNALTPSFLSSSVTPLSNQDIFTASASGYNAEIAADAKIQQYVTDGTNLYMIKSITDSAFADCTNITSVTIPDSVTSIGSKAFAGCTGLTSITIGANVASVGSNAFADSSTSWFPSTLNINKVNISSLEAWCNIVFPNGPANPLSNELYLNGVKITDLIIPNSVNEIKNYAFYNCSGLTSVTIPDSVTSIGDYAFDGCSNLQYNTDDENDTSGTLKYLGNESNKYIYLWGVTDTSLRKEG